MRQSSTFELADIVKGTANHHRLDILMLLANQDKIPLETIAEVLDINYKTAAVHVSRLHRSGLISKRYRGAYVQHSLTPRGLSILKFLRKLE